MSRSSTKKRFNSAARVSKHRNARSCLTSSHNDISRATRIIGSYVEAGDYLSDDLDATRIICGNFPGRNTTIRHSSAIMQLRHYASVETRATLDRRFAIRTFYYRST